MRALSKLAFLLTLLAVPTVMLADDWPQWRGPDGTGVSKEKGLLKTWPEGGPKLLWTCKEAGNGYTAPAIVGDVVYTMGALKDGDYLIALSVKDGMKLWATKVGPSYPKTQWSDGPNSTPTVDKDLIFALSSNGDLACFNLKGKQIWTKDLQKDFSAQVNPIFADPKSQGWGFCWSPLVDGDNLIITPGGAKGLFVALNKTDGKTVVWQSKDVKEPCTYATPIVADVHGTRQYIAIIQDGAVGVDAKTGAQLWRYQRKTPFSDIVSSTPIYHNGLVFLSGKGGSDLIELTKSGEGFTASVKGTTKDFVNWLGGAVFLDNHIYGAHESRNIQCRAFADAAKDKPVWDSGKQVAGGAITCADGLLYVVTDKGDVFLIDATPQKYTKLGKFKLPPEGSQTRPQSGQIWTHPVVANGRLYLRDQELIYCYEVAK